MLRPSPEHFLHHPSRVVGVDVLMDWTRSHTLFARSPNFASQSYTMETGRQMDTMVLFNVSLGLGLTPARPMIVRK